MRIITFIILVSPLFSFAQVNPASIDPNKFTICSITINSDNERKLFEAETKKNPSKFNPVVELTNFGEDDWFQKACNSKIRCDQLIISGHFGGKFFGSSGKSLPIGLLENKGCSKSCEGILGHPYEVFLFGCNTLADKAKDHRSPQEYLQVLLADGIPRTDAELVVESRYGEVGDGHKSKMQRAFGGENKQLYGFNSVGPSGENVESFMKNYFKRINLAQHLAKKKINRLLKKIENANAVLAKELKSTAFAQCGAGEDKKNEITHIICQLRDERLSVDAKINITHDALAREDYLTFIPSINDFLKAHPPAKMNDEQKKTIHELSQNKIIKSQVLGLIDKTTSLSLASEWMQFASNLGFMKEEQVKEMATSRVKKLFETPLSLAEKDMICSTDLLKKAVLINDQIIKDRPLGRFDILAINCMGAQNPSIQLKIASAVKSSDENVRTAVMKSMLDIKPKDKNVIKKLSLALDDSNRSIRVDALAIMEKSGIQDHEIQSKIAGLLKDREVLVRRGAARAIGEFTLTKETEVVLTEALKDSDPGVRNTAKWALENLRMKK